MDYADNDDLSQERVVPPEDTPQFDGDMLWNHAFKTLPPSLSVLGGPPHISSNGTATTDTKSEPFELLEDDWIDGEYFSLQAFDDHEDKLHSLLRLPHIQ